jgi:hypothetical protein
MQRCKAVQFMYEGRPCKTSVAFLCFEELHQVNGLQLMRGFLHLLLAAAAVHACMLSNEN